MVHLRIIAPADEARKALELLTASPAVTNVVHLPGLARKPKGDMILCDVTRPDASIIVEELRQIGIAHDGSISMEPVETQLSVAAELPTGRRRSFLSATPWSGRRSRLAPPRRPPCRSTSSSS